MKAEQPFKVAIINCTVGMGKLAIILMSLRKRPKSNLT